MSDAEVPPSPRLALITGASRGIGRALALAFAKAGVHVVALARTQGALTELDDEIRAACPDRPAPATLAVCDLTDYAALDRLGRALFERWGRLDIFIGNAGVLGPLSPLAHIEPKQWDHVLAVNLSANWRLIRSLDPLLRASSAGRAVFISSSAAHRAPMRAYWGLYSASKAALDAMALTYAAETAQSSSVKVMLVNPGALRTKMRASAMPGEDPLTLRSPDDLAPKVLELCAPEWGQTGKIYDFPSDQVLTFQAPY